MNFNKRPAAKAYVWVWLPNQNDPVVAGLVEKRNGKFFFTYGKSYRERENAISLSPFELPLQTGTFEPMGLNNIHSCLRDAAPDAWGRRVISHEYPGLNADELDYMLLSGSNRVGALDFQESNSEYRARIGGDLNLPELMDAAHRLERGLFIAPALGKALLQGTSVGGARPKCLINEGSNYYLAKFSLSSDIYDIIKAEYICMRMANLVSLNVPKVQLRSVLRKNILLVQRFDRTVHKQDINRHLLLSGLSLLGLNELEARYASYIDLAEIIRTRFQYPKEDLMELYQRIIFNVLMGNTDDHARNHSAFWNGKDLNLTPAYDLLPQLRAGQEATQAMSLDGIKGNASTLRNVLSICEHFLLTPEKANEMINNQVAIIKDNWVKLCEEADLQPVERNKLWEKAILNPFCFYGWEGKD